MVKIYIVVLAFVLLAVHARSRSIPGGDRSHDKGQTLKLPPAPMANPPGGSVDEQKNFIFGGIGGFGGMGGFIGGLFPHLGGVGVIGKFGGIGIGHSGLGGGIGGVGGVGGGVGGLPYP